MTFGFIGTGNMGSALAKALSTQVDPGSIYLHNRTEEKSRSLAQQIGGNACSMEQAVNCDYVFLGVKPQMLPGLLDQLKPMLNERTTEFTLVSMAAGITISTIQQLAGGTYPVIRIMPNTPVEIGSGIVLYDASDTVSPQVLEAFCRAMCGCGLLDRLPESLMDAGTSVAGCGPAFVFLFLEALAAAGVSCGLPQDKALLYAKQMLFGAAKLASESNVSPEILRNAVCSPGGSTIQGVRTLQEKGVPQAICSAVESSFRRNIEMGQMK